MAAVPSPVDVWIPLSPHQFIDAAASTALTIPSIASQGGNLPRGCIYVVVLTCQGIPAYIRQDGTAVTAAITGGKLLTPGDTLTIYGLAAIKNVRLIRSGAGGTVAAEYYYFVPAMN